MTTLNVYISEGCWTCEETRRIVADIQTQFPKVDVALLDTEPDKWPERVFAVPTYMLDGRIISLGNPDRQHLAAILRKAQANTLLDGEYTNGVA